MKNWLLKIICVYLCHENKMTHIKKLLHNKNINSIMKNNI